MTRGAFAPETVTSHPTLNACHFRSEQATKKRVEQPRPTRFRLYQRLPLNRTGLANWAEQWGPSLFHDHDLMASWPAERERASPVAPAYGASICVRRSRILIPSPYQRQQ